MVEFPEGEDPSLYDMRIIECSYNADSGVRCAAAVAGRVAWLPAGSADGTTACLHRLASPDGTSRAAALPSPPLPSAPLHPPAQVWLFMRERKDKDTPNATHVYESVARSIKVQMGA